MRTALIALLAVSAGIVIGWTASDLYAPPDQLSATEIAQARDFPHYRMAQSGPEFLALLAARLEARSAAIQ